MPENELLEKMDELKALQVKAGAALNPFTKAAIAEQAVSVSIDLLEELVNREVGRHAST